MKRRKNQYAVFYDRHSYPLKQFLAQSQNFSAVFLHDAEIAAALRDTGFEGDIFMFTNFKQLTYSGFFIEYSATPVVTGKVNYDKASRDDLSPVYFISDKSCIADFGLCISRKGDSQYFYNCDNRCREKSKTKSGVYFPVSIKPEKCCPQDGPVLQYTEEPFFTSLQKGHLREPVYESNWNYRYPLGKKILSSGKGEGKRFVFTVDKLSQQKVEKELTGFYGYKGSLYKGKWFSSVKILKAKNGKVSVEVSEDCENLLMIEQYTEKDRDFLKKARHFIFTLPEEKILEEREERKELSCVKNPPQKRFSDRIKMTLISDDTAKFTSFKGRYVERKVLVYKGENVGKYFSDHILLDGLVEMSDIEKIAALPRIKGIVVNDSMLKIHFEKLFPHKEIILHPLSYTLTDNAPTYLSASTTVFTSVFKSDKRKNYSWPDINLYLKNRKGCLEFISKKRLIKKGGRRELWVDLTETDSSALNFLKIQAENIVRSRR